MAKCYVCGAKSPQEIVLPYEEADKIYRALYVAKDRLGNYQLVNVFPAGYTKMIRQFSDLTVMHVPALEIIVQRVHFCGVRKQHKPHTWNGPSDIFMCDGSE